MLFSVQPPTTLDVTLPLPTQTDNAAQMSDAIEPDLPDDVMDDAESDDEVSVERYDITSFGADYDVEGLVKRLDRGDVLIPEFQRDYVWNQKEASRFVESLLLGLPVPGVFMAREAESNKLLVIDGQQRLKTLQFFFGGVFKPHPDDKAHRVFKLTKVQPQFEGKTYKTLDANDRVKLNDSIIHATIVKQESPSGDDTSIYHIFERLNYGGRRLTPQEIRVAIYHGDLVDTLKQLNEDAVWREVFGRKSPRLKDQELILRYFAFVFDFAAYHRPMNEFLNKFASRNKNAAATMLAEGSGSFRTALRVLHEAIGKALFRPERTLNAAVFDSMMIGMTRRLEVGGTPDPAKVRAAYDAIRQDDKYVQAVSRSTADEKFVKERIETAVRLFSTT